MPAKSDSETVFPPSRGNRNAGAFAPAASPDSRGPDAGDFLNGFDAASCDAAEIVLAALPGALLPDFPAFAGRAFDGFVFADLTDAARAALRATGLEDFLRVFLDIRLPFVAFGRSIIGVAGLVLANRNQVGGWASLMASEYGYKEFDVPPSLIALPGPDDE